MKSRLEQIFSDQFSKIKSRNVWKKYLDNLGVDRKGKLMAMLIPCPPDHVEIKDPLGEEVVIRINKELALKIAILGFIPEEK